MTVPTFSLTKKLPLTIYRKAQGMYVRGRWVEGEETTLVVMANVQPLRDSELLKLPEADRQRKWLKLYVATPETVREAKQGSEGYGADEFIWEGERYEVMKSQRYSMGVLDHTRGMAARVEISAGVQSNG